MGDKGHEFMVPKTEEDIARYRAIFRNISSYRSEDNSISAEHIGLLHATVEFDRTPETIVVYKTYWEFLFGGRVPEEVIMEMYRTFYDGRKFGNYLATTYDRNGDGFISQIEFGEFFRIMKAHDPAEKTITYEEFVKNADANSDGQVSIEEFANWIDLNFDPKTN